MNTKAKKMEPQIKVAALNKKRRNRGTCVKLMSLAPKEPKKKRIMKEETPNQRFINRSER